MTASNTTLGTRVPILTSREAAFGLRVTARDPRPSYPAALTVLVRRRYNPAQPRYGATGLAPGKPRYWAMAERTLHNHLLQNQSSKGGFGHRRTFCDNDGVYGFGHEIEESTWCCTFHGELAFIQFRKHLLSRTNGELTCNFALDFSASDPAGTVTSVLRPGQGPGEVLRQRLSLAGQPATVVRVRRPHWANAVTAVDATGAAVTLQTDDAWCATAKPVNEVEFIFAGGVYAENRRCTRLPDGPKPGEPFVTGYGPKLLAAEGRSAPNNPAWPATIEALDKHGLKPMSPELRRKDGCFVIGCGK